MKMCLLTFSILRNCKFKQVSFNFPRQLSNDVHIQKPELETEIATDEGNLVEVSTSWGRDEQPELRLGVTRDLRVLRAFLTEREEAAMLAELEPVLRRMRYQFDHWDNAIHGYRETERAQWRDESEAVLARVRAEAFGAASGAGEPLAAAHVLDLAPAGHIKPHVDAVRFCGDVIAGLSLASTAVMRLEHATHKHLALHALLPRRSLYIMRGVARYEFTHAVLGGDESAWRGARVPRRRRVAVILRSRPAPSAEPNPAPAPQPNP